MALELITPPDDLPITVEEAKAFLNVTHDDHDELIEGLILAATGALDGRYGILGRALEVQTWEMVLDRFPLCYPALIEIPLPPLIRIDSVTYLDSDAVEQTVDDTTYEVDANSVPARLRPVSSGSWPSPACVINAVRVRFTAGYEPDYVNSGDEVSDGSTPISTVPAPIKVALKIMVADLYENRESVTANPSNAINIPMSVDRLLSPYKIRVIA